MEEGGEMNTDICLGLKRGRILYTDRRYLKIENNNIEKKRTSVIV